MSDLTAIINEVYITPIKSVLFVDDQFPTFGRLCEQNLVLETPVAQAYTDDEDFTDTQSQRLLPAKQESSFEADGAAKDSPDRAIRSHYDRVKYLTDSCRAKGFIFDVESDFSKLLPGPTESGFFNKPDLIVLDYHLEPGVHDGARALDIIRRLNDSPRFNLVIVHTSVTPLNAAQEIAFALRGPTAFEEHTGFEERTRGFTPEKLGEHLLDYLNAKKIDLPVWRRKLSAKKITEADTVTCFEKLLVEWFSTTQTEQKNRLLGCGGSDARRPWVRGNNVFVVVVQKPDPAEESIGVLLDALRASLEEYRPAPLTMLLQHIVNVFKTHGEEVLDSAFGDTATRAALLLYSLTKSIPTSGDASTERNFRVADLAQRALTTLAHGLPPHIQDLGGKILADFQLSSDHAENSRRALAREKATPGISPETLNHHLNAFLGSQRVTRAHMTTGMVFRRVDDPSAVWVCVSPACDLVPAQAALDDRDYRIALAPFGYFEALRMKRVEAKEAKKPANGQHIFLNHEGQILVYEFAMGNGNRIFPCIFYTQENGHLGSANMLKLYRVVKQSCAVCGDEACDLAEIQAEVIAQLRPEFANRILTQKGAWDARIGVDFVNLKP